MNNTENKGLREVVLLRRLNNVSVKQIVSGIKEPNAVDLNGDELWSISTRNGYVRVPSRNIELISVGQSRYWNDLPGFAENGKKFVIEFITKEENTLSEFVRIKYEDLTGEEVRRSDVMLYSRLSNKHYYD